MKIDDLFLIYYLFSLLYFYLNFMYKYCSNFIDFIDLIDIFMFI